MLVCVQSTGDFTRTAINKLLESRMEGVNDGGARDVLRTVNFDSQAFHCFSTTAEDVQRVTTGVTTLSIRSQENGENGHRADRRSDAAAQSGGVDGVGADGVARGAALQGDTEVIDNGPSRVLSWRWTFAGRRRS